MKKCSLSFLFLFLLLSPFLFPKTSFAYIDYSIHRVETGGFLGEENAKSALQSLISATGWWANYEPTGKDAQYYQVYSGGFHGEQNVKDILNQFQTSTGFNASYQPLGNPDPFRKVVSGSFYGEKNIQNILKNFTDETGLSATYEPSGEGTYKKKIISGAFLGEENVKQALQEFQVQTGISATYQPTGQYQEYLQVVSGGFYGEDNVKSILQNFTSNTGINATYEPVKYSDYYIITTGGFYGEENVKAIVNQIVNDLGISVTYVPGGSPNVFNINFEPLYGDSLAKATGYLDSKHWWYSKDPTGKKIATTFRIVSEQTMDQELLNKALNFYKNHDWWVTTNPTGNKVYNKFNIVSDSILEKETIKKGLDFFATKGWWFSTQTTNEKGYLYFKIVTDPYVEKENIDKAVNFFEQNHWWNTIVLTGKTVQTNFQIISDPLLGKEKSDQALNFFTQNHWWATSQPIGSKVSYYKIVTGGFQGYDNAVTNARMVTDRFGWWTTTVKLVNGPKITSTNYNFTFNDMLNLEMTRSPKTDKYRNEPAYIYSAYISDNKVNVDKLNVRKGPGTSYEVVEQLSNGFKDFTILGNEGDWTKIYITWKDAKIDDVSYYLNSNNFPQYNKQYYQFLELSQPADTNVDEINEKILNDNAGKLKGTAVEFAKAAQLYKVNELYLISHALHETGNGTSDLAKGVIYNGQLVYNMYGYGAYDGCSVNCGAQKAYEQGWTTPDLAIIGGAKLISSGYIYNTQFQQDTLYKMRWNPVNVSHQYATDIGWAANQVTNLYNYYQLLDNYTLYFDLPVYK
jgi:beta-N-acetylglucosaminidase